jgi:two-component system, NarL family, invasion response regulator UvrY
MIGNGHSEAVAPITVMLVDDHALVRGGVKHLLKNITGIKVVAEADSGEEALQMARELSPAVVLMDFDMPTGICGLETTYRLLKSLPRVRVVILSAFSHELIAFRFLEVGVKGFVAKGASANEMVKAIQAVNNGKQYISEELAERLALVNVNEPKPEPFNCLSNKELQMVFMIAKGLRTQEISAKLHLSSKTVSTYRSSLCNKLGVKNEVELTLLAMKHRLLDVEKI